MTIDKGRPVISGRRSTWRRTDRSSRARGLGPWGSVPYGQRNSSRSSRGWARGWSARSTPRGRGDVGPYRKSWLS